MTGVQGFLFLLHGLDMRWLLRVCTVHSYPRIMVADEIHAVISCISIHSFLLFQRLAKSWVCFSILISPSTKVLGLHGKYYGISFLSLFHVVYSLYIYTILDIHILQNLTPAETSSD
jgi:hypothetical protein